MVVGLSCLLKFITHQWIHPGSLTTFVCSYQFSSLLLAILTQYSLLASKSDQENKIITYLSSSEGIYLCTHMYEVSMFRNHPNLAKWLLCQDKVPNCLEVINSPIQLLPSG